MVSPLNIGNKVIVSPAKRFFAVNKVKKKKNTFLPSEESNPGLPHNSRGYSLLHYRCLDHIQIKLYIFGTLGCIVRSRTYFNKYS